MHSFRTATGPFPDYTPVNREITFSPSSNQLMQCTMIAISDNSVQEATEMFQVVVTTTDPDISIRPVSNTVVMIRNDDGKSKHTHKLCYLDSTSLFLI